MSGSRIPAHNGKYKALIDNLPDNVYIDIHHILPNSERQTSAASKSDATPVAQRPRRAEKRKSGLWAVVHAARQHGFTHPKEGGFLQLPREFDAILALEDKAVAQVVLEVLRQTIGWVGDGEDGRREWAEISQRHFARAGLMTQKAA